MFLPTFRVVHQVLMKYYKCFMWPPSSLIIASRRFSKFFQTTPIISSVVLLTVLVILLLSWVKLLTGDLKTLSLKHPQRKKIRRHQIR